jgi:hypothetical protein
MLHSEAVLVACSVLFAGCGKEPEGLDAPASALHDVQADVYLVSNVQGAPLDKDGNGYIARVLPGGGMQRHWIQGGRDGVTLHAPKGMALVGDVLWVADIDTLRRFDRNTGKPLGDLAIPGATCLDDVSASPDGTVFCTDRGLDAQSQSTGTDAIWKIGADGPPVPLARGAELGQPSGIVALAKGTYYVSWRDGTFCLLDGKGVSTVLSKAPQAQLDGLVRLDTSPPVWLATSWAGNCLFRFDVQGGCTAIGTMLEQPADIGYDVIRHRLLVPLSGQNRLEMLQQ